MVTEIVNQGAGFVRNMILARLLTKADFGVAATLAMIITLLEFCAKLGVARFVIQCREGNQKDFIASAHLVQFGAGILSALILAGAAIPMGVLFGLEDRRWALLALALIPVCRGLEHMDARRFERNLRFGPSALIEVVPQLVITLASWPVAMWLGDYRAVLILLIAKTLMSALASHVVAEEPYRWNFNREYVGRMLRFGWPLLVNGFLMFGVLHGDQFIVASFYTMSVLGPYAAALAVTMAPTFFFGRIFSSVMLPVMSRLQDDPVAFERRYRFIIAVLCAFSATYAVGFIVGAEAIMQIVFGKKYEGAGVILAWLSVANGIRNVRIASSIAAMAKGDSANQMIANFWRVSTLLFALGLAYSGKPVWMIAATGVGGELLASAASFRRLHARDKISWGTSLQPAALVLLAMALAGWMTLSLGLHQLHLVVAVAVAGVAGCLCGGIVSLVLRDSRVELLSLWTNEQLRESRLGRLLFRTQRKPAV